MKMNELVLKIILFILLLDKSVLGDYENTWNSYYEQPCCGSPANQQHHLRHHKGNFWFFYNFCEKYTNTLIHVNSLQKKDEKKFRADKLSYKNIYADLFK